MTRQEEANAVAQALTDTEYLERAKAIVAKRQINQAKKQAALDRGAGMLAFARKKVAAFEGETLNNGRPVRIQSFSETEFRIGDVGGDKYMTYVVRTTLTTDTLVKLTVDSLGDHNQAKHFDTAEQALDYVADRLGDIMAL